MKPMLFNGDKLLALVHGQLLNSLADKLYRSREIPIEPWYQRRYFDEGRKPWSTSHDRARTVACISGAPS